MLSVDLLAVHSLAMNISDKCDFLEVSKTCYRLNRSTFLLSANPLAMF